jgi:hypothetical protein
MKKIVVSIFVVGLLFTITIVSVNASVYNIGESILANPNLMSVDDEVWSIETVDSNGNVGRGTSLAIDLNGYPHICYFDRNNHHLKYVRFNGLEWEEPQIIDTQVAAFNSLALDSNNRPHIAYAVHKDNIIFLKYVRWNGSVWEQHIVDTVGNVGWFVSLALDDYDIPHLSYLEKCIVDGWSVYFLKYAYWDNNKWQVEFVDDCEVNSYCCSIDIDTENNPHIAYVEEIVGEHGWIIEKHLKHAYKNNDEWIKEIVVKGWSVESSTFAIDSNDDLHFCYSYRVEPNWERNYPNQILDFDLYYAYRNNDDFRIINIDDSIGHLDYISIAIDSNDSPHISYRHKCLSDPDQNELKYATIKEDLWRIELVGSENRECYGRYNSIAIDGEDIPHISFYYDYYEGGLMYAKKIRDEMPPLKPTIEGPVNGKINKGQEYIYMSSDPDGQDLYYYIDWDDCSIEEWIGPYKSGEEVIISHIWEYKDNYAIKAKVRDIYGVESDTETLTVVIMSRNKMVNRPFLNLLQGFFESHPNSFPLLQRQLGL